MNELVVNLFFDKGGCMIGGVGSFPCLENWVHVIVYKKNVYYILYKSKNSHTLTHYLMDTQTLDQHIG